MKKSLTLMALATLLAVSAFAVPARPGKRTVAQADGTTLTLTARGDEHFHFLLTEDGLPVVRTAEGSFCYAQVQDGKLAATTLMAHDEALRTAAERAFISSSVATRDDLQTIATAQRARRMAVGAAKERLNKQAKAVGQPQRVNAGQRRGLVILVNYADQTMAASHTREVFERQFNEEGYTDNGNSMSVRDYFLEQSYGQFDLSFDVVGPVTLTKNMAYYGGNDSRGSDLRPGEMIAEACQLVDDDVDFTTYDWDGDGEAEMVFVVYAGYGEASNPYSGKLDDTIWPHQWYLSSQGINLTLDGVRVDNYACSSELDGDSGSTMDGIGTACHEFSHCFGLPDLYDTTGGSVFGMSYWSLLALGCYCGGGYVPCGYTSYERWASGWMEPVELNEATTITGMKPLAETAEAYVLYNDAHPDEYYLLENRQYVNSDSKIYGHGMLVLHVDYDETAWYDNSVNTNQNRQRCTIIAADNSYSTANLYGDPFPGTSETTQLTGDKTSRPFAILYNAGPDGTKYMRKPITNITETDEGLISFDFMGGSGETAIALPTALSANDRVVVFSTSGQKVCATTYADFRNLRLPHGVYVVQTGKGIFKLTMKN